MQIVNYPHPTLRHKSKPIRRVDAQLKKIVREMFELMYEANGIGLAANQVDLPLRLFVINLTASPDESEERVFINPVLSQPKGLAEQEEGCLSLPGLHAEVTRPQKIQVNAYDLSGKEIQLGLDDLFARVVQHENDHLDGVLFTDRLSETGRMQARPALEEFEIEYQSRQQRGEIPGDEQIGSHLVALEEKYC